MSSNYCHSSSFFFLHELFSFLPFNMKCVSRWIIFKVEKKKINKCEFIRENCQRRSSTEMGIDEVGWDDTRWVLWTPWRQRSVDIRVINVAYELQILHEEHIVNLPLDNEYFTSVRSVCVLSMLRGRAF